MREKKKRRRRGQEHRHTYIEHKNPPYPLLMICVLTKFQNQKPKPFDPKIPHSQ
jgi:hypothetical protein